MILKMFTVFDRKAVAHLTPFHARSDAEAIRILKETLLSGNSKLSQWPGDYHLYGLGEFDDQTGVVIGCDRPEPIASMEEILEDALREVRRRADQQMDLEDALSKKPAPEDLDNTEIDWTRQKAG